MNFFLNASTKQKKISLNCCIFGKRSYRNVQTYTEKPSDTVVKKAAVGVDNLGPSPSSVTDELGVSRPTSLCLGTFVPKMGMITEAIA